MFTVWYICTPVACDSRYTRFIDRYHNFASIFSILRNVLTLQIASFIFFDSTVTFSNMRMYFEFIEMVPFISNDCTVTSCTHVWLL